MVSFPQVSSSEPCAHLSLPPYAPHALALYTECKGKAVPLHTWSGPGGSRKLRFTDFMTTAQDGGKIVSLTHRPPLPPGNTPGTHLHRVYSFIFFYFGAKAPIGPGPPHS